MAKVEFNAYWYKSLQVNVQKGLLVLRPAPYSEKEKRKEEMKKIGLFLNKLEEYQNNKIKKAIDSGKEFEEEDLLRELKITIEYFYRKRTLSQNNLMWALYEVLANELNGNQKGHKDQMHFPKDLYEQDLIDYAEREKIITKRKRFLDYYEHEGFNRTVSITVDNAEYEINTPAKIKEFVKIDIPGETEIIIKFIRSSSLMNTVELANWINMLFNRLSYMGIDLENSQKIKDYWIDWKQNLNKEKIILHDEIMTKEQYREAVPICEATGEHIGTDGEIAHIVSVGMGNDRTKEPKYDHASKWLHLKTEVHRFVQHQKGWKEFLKEYPHLQYKVETAFSRSYKIEEPENKEEELDIF